MKRWYLAAVAGLCAVVPASAQEGSLAPTAPMVPAPVLQNGSVQTPSGVGGSRPFMLTKWSPLRNPATASVTEPVSPSATTYGHPMPPLPTGVGGYDGSCGAGGCAPAGRDRSCREKLKAWLCYHPSPTELPKCQPTPYVTPLLGMFPCSSGPGYGCASGCVAGNGIYAPGGQPVGPTTPNTPQPMTQPMTPPGGTAAAPVVMPPRGTQGMIQPTWQGRVTPAPASADPGLAGYRFAAPESKPGPVVNTSLKVPAPK